MSNINLYNLSNKIRTILLTTIDKEMLLCSKKNFLLINSQNSEQLMKKFENYRDFTIESEESFEGVQNNEDNKILYDLKCNYSNNKFNCFYYSSKTSNERLFQQRFITKSLPPKKNNLGKLKISSRKKLIPKMKSSSSSKEIVNFNNSLLLNNDNSKIHIKIFSADLYNYSVDNKNYNNSKLINYCYNLKKPNDEIINEISNDDTSTNKEDKDNVLFQHIIKNNHKKIHKKKLKKTIKKKITNKKKLNKDDELSISSNEQNNVNFTNKMKYYLSNIIEKSNSKEKLKIQLEQASKSKPFCIQETNNKKPVCKKLRHLKSIDKTHIILKNKENKIKKEKREKNDTSISISTASDAKFQRKNHKISKTLCKRNNVFRQNEALYFRKKILKTDVNDRNERKRLNIPNINYNNKIIHMNYSIDKERILKKSLF